MLNYRKSIHILRIVADFVSIIITFISAYHIKSNKVSDLSMVDVYLLISLILFWVYTSKITNLYDEFRSRNFSFELVALIKNVLIQDIAVIMYVFFVPQVSLSRLFAFRYPILLIVIVAIEKYIIRKLLNRARSKGRNSRNVLIIGAGNVGRQFYDSIYNNPHFGYKLLGFLDDIKDPALNGSYLGPISHLQNILREKVVNDIIIALPNHAAEKIEEVIGICEKHAIRVRIIPDYFKFLSKKYSVSMFGNFPIISVREDALNKISSKMLKRIFDISVTLLLLLTVFSWMWPVLIILQKILNPGPVFYKAARWGENGKEFICYKFRTMVPESKNISDNGIHKHSSKHDPRITRFGKILRKTNLDELPQFINVIKGDMSLVGPRPHDVQENIEIKDRIESYMWRHVVKPGITGWAQVNGFRGGTKDICLMRKRTEYDIWYIENWTFLLDIQILTLTVWRMIKGDPNAY